MPPFMFGEFRNLAHTRVRDSRALLDRKRMICRLQLNKGPRSDLTCMDFGL